MALNITLNLPPDVEKKLRAETGDIDADVTEVYVVELFRRGKLSHYELSQMLGLDRFATDAYLKRQHIYEGSPTMEDLDADRQTLDQVMKEPRR